VKITGICDHQFTQHKTFYPAPSIAFNNPVSASHILLFCPSYLLLSADLHTLSSPNILSKYADDTTLISPQTADIVLLLRFSNLISWSQCNKLTVNLTKTKELVFRKPSVRSHFYKIVLQLMLNALTNSDFLVYVLLLVFLWTNMLILFYQLSLSVFTY